MRIHCKPSKVCYKGQHFARKKYICTLVTSQNEHPRIDSLEAYSLTANRGTMGRRSRSRADRTCPWRRCSLDMQQILRVGLRLYEGQSINPSFGPNFRRKQMKNT